MIRVSVFRCGFGTIAAFARACCTNLNLASQTSRVTAVSRFYRFFLGYPKVLLLAVLALTCVAIWQARTFTFDASADTLVVQGDPKLATYLEMSDLFGGDEFLVLAYSPKESPMFAEAALQRLSALQAEVAQIKGVAGVFSILDAPLIKSPPIPLEEMSEGYKTLRDKGVDLELARQELTTSPLFRNYLVAADGTASAISIDLERDDTLNQLREQRDAMRAEPQVDPAQLATVEADYRAAREAYVADRAELISAVRQVRDRFDDDATIYISGVPMIAADMIKYVKSDLALFGSLVFGLIVMFLAFFFRRVRWVVLPIVVSALSILMTVGILSFFEKPVTVISSNFISLLAIICISFSIHLIVRYRELLEENPEIEHSALVLETMESKFAPCVYTALTTMLAFGSMLASRIVPVEDFGWMMCLGIVLAFFVTYIVFPALLLVLGKGEPSSTLGSQVELTVVLSRFCVRYSGRVLIFAALVAAVAVVGLSKVSFDNRFVDYFDEDTDINAGMIFIDQHLGGTLPFDVYLQLGKYEAYVDEDDPFASPSDDDWPERYWFTDDRIAAIRKVHENLEAKSMTGKVISLATLERVTREFNEGEALTNLELAYVLGQLPETVRERLIEPYAKPASGYARLNARIMESGPHFSRLDLIKDVRQHATSEAGFAEDEVIVTGMLVLFNDMLQQLAESQKQTLLYVVLATFFMFALLLRSIKLALLALIPNIIAAASVVSIMGYANIPLDMMTITIAAICIGIGVDDAIHYLHRFREEYQEGQSVTEAVQESHLTIGRAMYFTTMVIIGGFSILAFSNFLPTVYFGILTAIAMGLAMLANLTVLPSLLIRFYR